MPTSKKRKKVKVMHSAQTQTQQMQISKHIVPFILFVASFAMALLFTSQMTSAMNSLIFSAYDRQVRIGSDFDALQDIEIETGFATSTFQLRGNKVVADFVLMAPYVLNFQVFNSTSTSANALITTDSYACKHTIYASELHTNQLSVECNLTSLSPQAGQRALVRYYYAANLARPFCGDQVIQPGEECEGVSATQETCIKNDGTPGLRTRTCTNYCMLSDWSACEGAICGNGLIEFDEVCDDGEVNGRVQGRCNATCTGTQWESICGDGVIATAEICDEGELNGRAGHCNTTCTGMVGTNCPDYFTLSDQGTSCISGWSTNGELSCLTKCTSVISQYPNANYRCYQSGTESTSGYLCIGDTINTTTSGTTSTTKGQPVKKSPSSATAQ